MMAPPRPSVSSSGLFETRRVMRFITYPSLFLNIITFVRASSFRCFYFDAINSMTVFIMFIDLFLAINAKYCRQNRSILPLFSPLIGFGFDPLCGRIALTIYKQCGCHGAAQGTRRVLRGTRYYPDYAFKTRRVSNRPRARNISC